MFRSLLGLASCLALLGCVGQDWANLADISAPSPLSVRGIPPERLALAEAVTQGGEIPLVPVPPPPLYKDEKGSPRPAGGKDKEKARLVEPAPKAILPPETPGPGGPVVPVEAVNTPNAENPPLEKLLEQAHARYASIDSYIARFTRRETVGGKREPEELMLFKFRKEPYSVYFKWLGEQAQGREVVFVQGKYDSKIVTLLAAGDIPFMPAGKRMALSPDNILVQSATRHPITKAGFGATLDSLILTHQTLARGDASRGQLADLGLQRRPDYPTSSLRIVEHTLPAGFEKSLPQGGKRMIGICPRTQLPVLIQTYDDKGLEVEYYRYDRLQPSVALDDLDFNPDVLWKKAE